MSTVPCTSNPIPNPHWWSTTPFLCSNTNPTGGKEDCASSLPLYTMPMCSGSHPTQIPLSRQHSDTSFDSNFPSTCNGSHSSPSTNPLATPPSPLSTSMCSNSCQRQLDTRNEHSRMPPSRTASAIEHKGFVSSSTAHTPSSPQKSFVEYTFSLANDEGPVHPESRRLSPPRIMQPPTNEHSPNCNNSAPMHNIHSILLPKHTTSTKIGWLFVHALLHRFFYSEDVHPYHLPFINMKIFADDDYRDRCRALPCSARDVVYHHQHASTFPLVLASRIPPQILVNENWICKTSTQRHHHERLLQSNARTSCHR